MKKLYILIFIVSALFSCKKAEHNLDLKAEVKKEFTTVDFQRLKEEVTLASQAINFSSQKVGKTFPANKIMRTESMSSMSDFSDCGSHLSTLYQASCFNGYTGEYLISQDYNINHPIVHQSFSSNLDLSISQIITGNTSQLTGGNLLVESGVTVDAHDILAILGKEQESLANLVQNDPSKSVAQMESEMIAKVEEQENKILNEKNLSYENKEFILMTLEIQKQSKDRYMIEMDNQFESGMQLMGLQVDSKRKSFFGKLWRGLAFVALSLATAGKFTAVVAAKAYAAAGKAAAFTKAVSSGYKMLGIGLAWVPTGATLIEKEKWNQDPWGDGSWEKWLKFGLDLNSLFTLF